MRITTKTGFTLIEILLTLGVLGVIVSASLLMFTSIMRGSNKAKTVNEVKQNGQYAISIMERLIRSALRVEDYDQSFVKIVNPDGGKTTFACEADLSITSNSASLINKDAVAVKNCSGFFSVVEGEDGITPDQITINFTLKDKGTNLPEKQAEANFQTTIILRNY